MPDSLADSAHTMSPGYVLCLTDTTSPLDARLRYALRVSGVRKRGVWIFRGPRPAEGPNKTINLMPGFARGATEDRRPDLTAFAKSRPHC